MSQETLPTLNFGDPSLIDASLSERVRGLIGSEILKIAADIRRKIRAGEQICNLTVGDFDARQFPIPEVFKKKLITWVKSVSLFVTKQNGRS